jgi:hypothetical protein
MTRRWLVAWAASAENRPRNFNQGIDIAKTKNRYNLSFRPKSYWEHSDPLQAILSGISGTARRQMITDFWNAGKFDQLESGLLEDELDEGTRQRLGAFHPFFMGGEYLPKRLPGEVAIVTIRLESTTFDVIELRARPLSGGKIGLRWVDEYDTEFDAPTDTIEQPFSFEELIRFIETSGPGLDENLPMAYTWMNVDCLGRSSESVEELRHFTSFSSDFYPGLGDWAQDQIDECLDKTLAEHAEDAEEDACGAGNS